MGGDSSPSSVCNVYQNLGLSGTVPGKVQSWRYVWPTAPPPPTHDPKRDQSMHVPERSPCNDRRQARAPSSCRYSRTYLLQRPESVGSAHATAPAADSAAPLTFAPPHGTLAHVLRPPAVGGDRRRGRARRAPSGETFVKIKLEGVIICSRFW